MDEAPIRPIEKKNDATKLTRVCFTIMASFIFGEGRHLREAHGNIKACHQRAADQMEQPKATDSRANVSADQGFKKKVSSAASLSR